MHVTERTKVYITAQVQMFKGGMSKHGMFDPDGVDIEISYKNDAGELVSTNYLLRDANGDAGDAISKALEKFNADYQAGIFLDLSVRA